MKAALDSRAGIWAIAHRGARRAFRENTLPAFDEALRQGCDGIELDVQLSRDRVPVVYHDRTLVRAGGGRRRVAQLEADELRRLVPPASRLAAERIPTLEEVLSRFAGRTRLLIEIKVREKRDAAARHLELLREVIRRLESLDRTEGIFLLCFDNGLLDAAAELAPRLPRVLNVKPTPRLGRRLRARIPSLHALSADVRTLSAGFGSAVRRTGRPLWVFTCNTPRAVERAIAAGASGIMSDRPEWLSKQLNRGRAS